MQRILGVFAHPHDAVWVTGGTLAKYAKAGAHIQLICATSGEGRRYLEKSAGLLGITDFTYLGYKEGEVSKRTPGEIEDITFGAMVDGVPNLVITFEPAGIDNDPDHIKVTLATTFAFQKYAKSAIHVVEKGISPLNPPRHPRDAWQISFADAVADINDPKLYYACMPESHAQFLRKGKIIPTESFGRRWRATEDKKVTTVIDIKQFARVKDEACAAFGLTNNLFPSQEFYFMRMQGMHEVFMGKRDRVSNRL
jgi:LmbE family N-acetylglucosaminyl deacetylase